jgi:penicillin-insensitive murein endopeptidase
MSLRRLQGAFALALTACAAAPRAPTASARVAAPAIAGRAPGEAPLAASDVTPTSAPTTEPPQEADENDEEGDDEAGDEGDGERPADATPLAAHPLSHVSDAEIDHRVTDDPAALGSMSIGKPNGGLLFNGVQMPEGAGWTRVDPSHEWGTEETVQYLETAIAAVDAAFPDSPKLAIGHISGKNGGYLTPHVSHQAGRDVDISYFYNGETQWYRRADANNLDTARTWAFVRALVTQTDVEMLLIDQSIQKLLRAYAEGIREDPAWLDTLFHGRAGIPPVIRHAPGHATHIHIRFYNPIAEETGRRCYVALVRHGMVHTGPQFAVHVAKKGETLAQMAKHFGTTVRAIRRANGMKSTVIQVKKAYRIPESGRAPPRIAPSGPIAIPPRRLPPSAGMAIGGSRPGPG